VTNRGSIQFKDVSPYQTLEISESAYGDDADLESVIGHNALRIRVARVRINHLGAQKAATQFCVELSRHGVTLEFK